MPRIFQKEPGEPRAFRHLGLELEPSRGGQMSGDCPFCGRAGKFSVEEETGLWRCLVCSAGHDGSTGGNPLTFLRSFWELCDKQDSGYWEQQLADERGFLDRSTLTEWGVVRSVLDGSWLVPGYSIDGRLDQLYRRIQVQDDGKWKWVLMPTPGIWSDGESHALHMPSMHHDRAKAEVHVMEGPWDGMAMWEVAKQMKVNGHGAEVTGNIDSSMVGQAMVVAVPGCNVWRSNWTDMCRGKTVTLWFDNDHPREHPVGSGQFTQAGRDGMRRVAGLLAGIAAKVRVIEWGGGHFDGKLPHGFDVRDWLVKGA